MKLYPLFLCGILAACAPSDSPTAIIGSLQNTGVATPNLDQTLSQYLASSGAPILQEDFLFGTAAAPAAGQTALTNATDLGTYFSPYPDFGGTQNINGTILREMPFTSSSNYVFGTDNLGLTLTLDAGGNVQPLAVGTTASAGVNLNGTSTPIANLGLANTTGISVGQLVAVAYYGMYYVSAFSANTSVTLTPIFGSGNSSPTFPCAAVFLPYYVAVASATSSGTTGGFTSPPAGIVAGMFAAPVVNNIPISATTNIVQSTGAGSVTFTTAQAITAGQQWIFFAPIRGGQLWSKEYWGAGFNGHNTVAMEVTIQLPKNYSGAQFTAQQATGAQFLALPATAPGGAGSAFWLYSGNGISGASSDSSELDIMEMYNNGTMDMTKYNGNNHGNFPGVIGHATTGYTSYVNQVDFGGNGSNYNATYNIFSLGTNLSLVPHKFGFVWTRNYIFRYIDGILMQVDLYNWSSGQPAQYSIGVSAGQLSSSGGSLLWFPNKNANLPFAAKVYEMKVWAQ